MVADCTAFNPQERITAGQAAYLLAKFNDDKNNDYNYGNAKQEAIQTYPKAIPEAIVKIFKYNDPDIKRQGIESLKPLILADPSYIETNNFKDLLENDKTVKKAIENSEEYGLALLRMYGESEGNNQIQEWVQNNRVIANYLEAKISNQPASYSLPQDVSRKFKEHCNKYNGDSTYGEALVKQVGNCQNDSELEIWQKLLKTWIKNNTEVAKRVKKEIKEILAPNAPNAKKVLACFKEKNARNNQNQPSGESVQTPEDQGENDQGTVDETATATSPEVPRNDAVSQVQMNQTFPISIIKEKDLEGYKDWKEQNPELAPKLANQISLKEIKEVGKSLEVDVDTLIELGEIDENIANTTAYGSALAINDINNKSENFKTWSESHQGVANIMKQGITDYLNELKEVSDNQQYLDPENNFMTNLDFIKKIAPDYDVGWLEKALQEKENNTHISQSTGLNIDLDNEFAGFPIIQELETILSDNFEALSKAQDFASKPNHDVRKLNEFLIFVQENTHTPEEINAKADELFFLQELEALLSNNVDALSKAQAFASNPNYDVRKLNEFLTFVQANTHTSEEINAKADELFKA